jgi:hypothetical protein
MIIFKEAISKDTRKLPEMTSKEWNTKYHYVPTNNDDEKQCSACAFARPFSNPGWHPTYGCEKRWDANVSPTVEGFYCCKLWKLYRR